MNGDTLVKHIAIQGFRAKAGESLVAAESEYANGRYNTCANRCYFSCFRAAVVALLRAGIRPHGEEREWGHGFVQAQFAGQLVTRRKLYSRALRDTVPQLATLLETADYEPDFVSQTRAARALRRAQEFVAAVRGG